MFAPVRRIILRKLILKELDLKDRYVAFTLIRDHAKAMLKRKDLSSIEEICLKQIEEGSDSAVRDIKERLGEIFINQII